MTEMDSATRWAKTVEENHDVWPPVVLTLDNRELVHRQRIVCPYVAEIQQPHTIACDAAMASG